MPTYEKFKKTIKDKITPDQFKKLKKGTKVVYMGDTYKVIDNDGYIIKLKDSDGKVIGVNLGQFNQRALVNEGVDYLVSDPEIQKAWETVYNTSFSKEHPNLFKILIKRPPIDERELNRLWEEMTGRNFKEDHPEVFALLFN